MDVEQPEDFSSQDEQVEITDLPGRTQPAHPLRQGQVRRAAQLFRLRWLRLAALLLLAALCLGLLLRTTPGLSSSFLSSFFGSTPTAEAGSQNIDLFYISAGPGWAHLTIDGTPTAYLPFVGSRAPLRLSPGTHQLRWQAAPFPAQSCTLSFPSHLADTCTAREITTSNGQERAWVVAFTASLLTLGEGARRTLISAIQSTLSQLKSSDVVHPGERFIDILSGNGPFNTASQELIATFRLSLDSQANGGNGLCMGGSTNTGSCQLNGQDCHALCTQISLRADIWNIVALVQTTWTYTTREGQIVAANMPDASGGAAFMDHFLPLSVSWDGQNWHVQARPMVLNGSDLIPFSCASSADVNTLEMNDPFGSSPWQAFSWNYLATSNPAAGCLLIIDSVSLGASSPTADMRIVYLHRFGIDLAVNHLAQAYDQQMPRPTAYELQLARQIAAQVHVSI